MIFVVRWGGLLFFLCVGREYDFRVMGGGGYEFLGLGGGGV